MSSQNVVQSLLGLKEAGAVGKAFPVLIQKLPHGQHLPYPSQGTPLSAGYDLSAAIEADITILPSQRVLVPTGFAIALPEGFEAQVRSRSGLAWKNGVVVLNSPGTIDADYRGEIKVILINHGEEPFVIQDGMRIAQLVISQLVPIHFEPVDILPETHRKEGGFGSTGLFGQKY